MRCLIISAAIFATGSISPAMAQPPETLPYRTEATPELAPHPYGATPEPNDAERLAFWNSPEMLDAREYVLDYSKRSKRTSQAKGEQYLQQVSELSAPAMKQWLEQVRAVRKSREGHQVVSESARQIQVEQAMQRIGESQQAPFNAQQSKMMIADYWQQLIAAQQLEEGAEAPLDRKAQIAAALEAQRLQFDPFAPALDPVSPNAYTRYAAAAALPGDLPRGDPANFSTGEATGGAAGGEASGSTAAAAAAVPAASGGGE